MMKLSEYQLPFTNDTSYAYAVGRIRALERRMLTRQDFARLTAAEDIETFFRILAESDYGALFSSVPRPEQFEDGLQVHLEGVLTLVDHLSRDPDVTDFLRDRYDFQQLKLLMKTGTSGRETKDDLPTLGRVDRGALAALVDGDETARVPDFLRRAFHSATDSLSGEKDPRQIDFVLDRLMLSTFTDRFRRSKILFLRGWLERRIDLVNITMYFRAVWIREQSGVVKESLCEGGSLGIDFYRTLQDDSKEALAQHFVSTRYARLVDEGVSVLRSKGSFSRLEQLADGYLIAFLRRAAMAAFGVEPLVAFALLKEYELRALRTAAVGVWNAIPHQSIVERLPDVYV